MFFVSSQNLNWSFLSIFVYVTNDCNILLTWYLNKSRQNQQNGIITVSPRVQQIWKLTSDQRRSVGERQPLNWTCKPPILSLGNLNWPAWCWLECETKWPITGLSEPAVSQSFKWISVAFTGFDWIPLEAYDSVEPLQHKVRIITSRPLVQLSQGHTVACKMGNAHLNTLVMVF